MSSSVLCPVQYLLIAACSIYSGHYSLAMFSSPGPRATPRRSMKPRESLARPPTLLDRATAETPTGSRTAVWRGRLDRSPTASVADSTRAGTAVAISAPASRHEDALDRTFWSRDERRAIVSAGGLPKEVVALIKASGMSFRTVRSAAGLDADVPETWFGARSAAMPTCRRGSRSLQLQKGAWYGTLYGRVSS